MGEGQPINQIPEEMPPEEPPVDEKAEAFRAVLRRMFQVMQEHNIYAVRSMGNLADFELANADPNVEQQLEDQMVEFYKHGSSGYFVFEGAHPELKSVLFKLKLNDVDPRKSAHNEMLFYRDLSPALQPYLEGRSIRLPSLYQSGFTEEGNSYIATEGTCLGKISHDTTNPLRIEEFQTLIEFIRQFQDTLTPDKVKELSPDLEQNDLGITSTFDKHIHRLHMFQREWADQLGPEYIAKMEKLLADNEQTLRNAPETFNNQDIIPSNIIRSEDGTFTVIDWERLKKVPNPAAAYNHMIEAHWRYPELQAEMIKRVLELNEDIPNFELLFRTDMIFLKYSGVYLRKLQDPNISPEDKAIAEAGLAAVTKFIKEALDEEGPWKKQ